VASTWRFFSQPSAKRKSQSAKPTAHCVRPQALLEQLYATTLFPEQTVGHAPQCSGLFVVWISQPLSGLPSQSWKPALHAEMPQRPLEQV